MEIAKVKINTELMVELCDTLFSIYDEKKQSYSKTVLPINTELVDMFFEEYEKYFDFRLGNTRPYISLISDNTSNELQIYIIRCDDSKIVTISDIGLKTIYFHKYDDKYNFIN